MATSERNVLFCWTCIRHCQIYSCHVTAPLLEPWVFVPDPHQYVKLPQHTICHVLTHGGRVTHICVSKLTIIGSDNGLSPGRRQALIWTNAGILLIEPLGTNFNETSIEIHTFSFKKIHLTLLSAKRRPFCLGLNVLNKSGWWGISLRVSNNRSFISFRIHGDRHRCVRSSSVRSCGISVMYMYYMYYTFIDLRNQKFNHDICIYHMIQYYIISYWQLYYII